MIVVILKQVNMLIHVTLVHLIVLITIILIKSIMIKKILNQIIVIIITKIQKISKMKNRNISH